MKATVTQYALDDEREVTVTRSKELAADAWAVRARSSRLSREAIAWRAANAVVPLARCPAWGYEPMPSSRDDEYIAEHTFTLAEALAVCEAEAPDDVAAEREACAELVDATAAWCQRNDSRTGDTSGHASRALRSAAQRIRARVAR